MPSYGRSLLAAAFALVACTGALTPSARLVDLPEQDELAGTGHAPVWVTVSSATVVRLDPATNDIAAAINVGGWPKGIAVGPDAVWVTRRANDDALTGTALRIDPAHNVIVAAIGVGHNPTDIAIGGENVWVINNYDATLSQIDPATDQVVAVIPVGADPRAVAASENAVWVTHGGGEVWCINSATQQVVAKVPGGLNPNGIAIGGGAVWVTSYYAHTLTRIDPDIHRILSTRNVGVYPVSVAVENGMIWITNAKPGAEVMGLDLATEQTAVTIGANASAGEVAVSNGIVWAIDGANGQVLRIDPAARRVVATIPVGNSPEQLSVGR